MAIKGTRQIGVILYDKEESFPSSALGRVTPAMFSRDRLKRAALESLFWLGLRKALPVAIGDLPNNPEHGVIRFIFQCANKVSE